MDRWREDGDQHNGVLEAGNNKGKRRRGLHVYYHANPVIRRKRKRDVIEHIRLHNYRNYTDRQLRFEQGINAVIAGNGRGKTNLLEALFYLIQGRSMRTSDVREMVRNGEEEAVIEANIYKGREIRIRNVIRRGGEVEGKRQIRDIGAVSFQPDDIWMVKGGPELRRKYLDEVVAETKRSYREVLREYQRTLKQRNEAIRAVRKGLKEREFMRFWNPMLYMNGKSIVEERGAALKELQREMTRLGEKWGKGEIELKYYTSMGDETGDEEKTMERIRKMEEAELRRGVSLIGPHRDELLLFLAGKNVRRECSQGEQKLVTIAWRLAQARQMEGGTGRRMLLLMDDCLSELDEENRRTVLDELDEWEQAILTTTDDSDELAGTHRIWLDGEGGG
ncbi:MAG: DNA replication and repair protein RecF [Actinobacteria bacterium]|nr:MAG: DNA replication and repair protein RecF [Actinomycetota bacterium]